MTPTHQQVAPIRKQASSPPKGEGHLLRNAVIVVGAIILLYLVSIPIRGHAAESYVEKGDSELSQKNYMAAELQYEKALSLKGAYMLAKERIALVEKASRDPLVLKDFYLARNESDKLKTISTATAFPENDNSALLLAKELIDKGEYQLAILPAKTASEMSPDYPEAWQYLSVANLKTANLAQISPEARSYYIDQSDKALAKARELDPSIKL